MTIGTMQGFRNGMSSARRLCTVSSLRWTAYSPETSPSLASATASAFSVRYAMPMVAEPLKFVAVRSISSTPVRMDKELPYHLVVGLPALSPTMDAGTLAEWYLNEGDSFAAGDAIAKIETDKAAMDFEAQDDGFVAKILVPAGGGNDLPIGTPIMVTVETADDVAAFRDFVAPATSAPAVAEANPAAAAVPAPPPPPPAAPVVAAVAPAVAAPVVAAAAPPPIVAAPAAAAPPTPTLPVSSASFSTAWGPAVAASTSPLAKSLAAAQADFIQQYGTTGQVPIL